MVSTTDSKVIIPARSEFWGHCSNLQVWAEKSYDTCFLHSSLAFPLLKKLAEVGDPLAKKVFKDEILKRINMGDDKAILFLLKNNYLDYFTNDELSYIYKDIVLKFESSELLLHFLKTLSFREILSDIDKHYKSAVINKLMKSDFKEKKRILLHHIGVLNESDLEMLIKKFKCINAKTGQENQRFRVLNILVSHMQSQYGEVFEFSNLELVQTLLVEKEQSIFLEIVNSSIYPYIKLNFETDEVRRRSWEEKLYYEFFEGYVNSIELYCDISNSKRFYEDLEKICNFQRLRHISILFFCGYKYNLVKNRLLSLRFAKKIKIYEFFKNINFPTINELK